MEPGPVSGQGNGGNHALQDYQMQLMLNEQQNKKRLMMARQEQDSESSDQDTKEVQAIREGTSEELPQLHYTISKDGIAADTMKKLCAMKSQLGHPQPTEATGSLQSTVQNQGPVPMQWQNAYYQGISQVASSKRTDQNPASTMPIARAQERMTPLKAQLEPHASMISGTQSIQRPGETDDGYSHLGKFINDNNESSFIKSSHSNSSPSPFDANDVQRMKRRIDELEIENSKLRQDDRRVKRRDDPNINVQIFYCLGGMDDDDNDETTYLSEPDWVIQGEEVILRARFPVVDPEGYVEDAGNVAFIMYKCYTESHQRAAIDEAIKTRTPLPTPEPACQDILPISDEVITAMEAFFDNYPAFRAEFPRMDKMTRMRSPYIWWYHCRKFPNMQGLQPRQRQLVTTLTRWIDVNYAPLYDKIDNQFRRGRVSNESIEYLIRQGDVLVSDSDGITRGYVAKSRPRRIYSWSVGSRSLAYAGDFFSSEEEITINFESDAEDGEVDITSLRVVPLEYASDEVRERLARRGKTFWSCRNKKLVSYERNSTKGQHAGQRFMVDFKTYNELHPTNSYAQTSNTRSSKETYLPTDGSEPTAPEIYLFPPLIPGFDLRHKKWTDLEVDQIRDVAWNDQAFSSLVADEDTKQFILALVTNQLSAEKGTDIIENKGNGLILLLHGSPGTGKTFTAESVAEIAKKPLYPVTCGDIGTEPESVEKYLESVFYLGKIWDCVVLLDEAEIFLEQRTLQDLKRNALVSVFLRALEYYEGILILTTNRVGTFDEAFKSRIQLALRYERLKDHERKRIWRNFFQRLMKLEESDSIDFDDIVLHIDELANYEMNGRQIRNSITTARQLAKYLDKKMNFSHLKRAISVSQKFDKYLADVREGEVEETGRGRDGRYSDEFFARSDQIR